MMRMPFFERPFVFLVPLFMIGILLGDVVAWSNWFVAPVFALLGFTLFLFYVKNITISWLFHLTVLVGFVLCGMVGINTARLVGNPQDQEQAGEQTLLCKITEIDGTQKEWRRALCERTHVVGESELIPINDKVLVYINDASVESNDLLLVHTEILPIENRNNPGEFDAKKYWNNKGIYSTAFIGETDFKLVDKLPIPFYDKWRNTAKTLLNKAFADYLDGDELAVAAALVLGDKSMLTSDVRNSFSAAGAMHVLAVSGLHIGIILQILMLFFGQIPRIFTLKRALLVSLLIIWAYAFMIGLPPSVVRATVMFTLLSLGKLTSQESDSLNILFFSAFLMLLFDPLLIYDIGFQLSYLAMLGIFTVYKPISAFINVKNKWLKKIWEGTAIGIAAQLFTFPLTLYYFHQFPNYFLVANIGMMFFAGIVLSLGILLLSVSWLGLLGKLVAIVFGLSLTAMLLFVQWFEMLPGALAEGFVLSPWTIIMCYVLILALMLFHKNRIVLRTTISLGILLLCFIQYSRYERMVSRELVVFNNNQVLIAYKNQRSTTFFYKAPESKLEKLKFIGDAYLKQGSSIGNYIALKDGTTTFRTGSNTLTLHQTKDGIHVTEQPSAQTFFIQTSHSTPTKSNMNHLTMPYLPSQTSTRSLSHSAFSLPLPR